MNVFATAAVLSQALLCTENLPFLPAEKMFRHH
jgi:hypothetical protein